jgi:hypothetical protein
MELGTVFTPNLTNVLVKASRVEIDFPQVELKLASLRSQHEQD